MELPVAESALPVFVELLIAEQHVAHPLFLPLVQIRRSYSGDSGAKCSVRAGAVAAEEDTEVE